MEVMRLSYIDLETEVKDGFPNIEKADCKILAITCYDSFLKKYINFAVNKNKKTQENDISYYWFENETDMLNKFIKFIQETDPDILLGWNSYGFDFPYIINRLKVLKINPNKLSRLNETCFTKVDDDTFKSKMFGRVLLDLKDMYKKLAQSKRESYSLEYISQYEFGKGKDKFDGSFKDLYEKDFDRYIKYNIRDVELLVMLDEKLKLVDYFDAIRRYAKCTFSDVFQNTKVIDSLILCFCKDKFVLPSKLHEENKEFEGAFVFEPPKGLFENIAVYDFKSLYPSIMYSFNISYETFGKEGINIDNKYKFSKDIGILPQIIKKLLDERVKYKSLMKKSSIDSSEHKAYDSQQYSVKILLNSIYGAIGYSNFRLFRQECAEAVTYMGRKIIKEASRIVEKNGFKVIYGDTDSLFVSLGNKSIKEGKDLKNVINKEIDIFVKQFNITNHIFEIQFEKVFKTLFFSGVKKRYCGLTLYYDDKEIETMMIVGFEERRSDQAQIGRKFQKELFRMVLEKKTKEETDLFINNFRNDIKTKYVPEEIALPIGISNDLNNYKNLPIHIRASKLANERHKADIRKGDKIKYIYVKKCPKGLRFENVIAFKDKLYEGYEIDYDKMIERIVDSKVETIYEALGWKNTLTKGKQQSLFNLNSQ